LVINTQHIEAAQLQAQVSGRYQHHLLAWRNKLVTVGGSYETAPGSVYVNDAKLFSLDLSTRQWKKQHTLDNKDDFSGGCATKA
jgi:hypothetical protein